jgi:hypothetical protein
MPAEPRILVAVIRCPLRLCGSELEGTWLEPEDAEEDTPEKALQLCPECGHRWAAEWPGFSFKTEAG